jgi:hypothetical protein
MGDDGLLNMSSHVPLCTAVWGIAMPAGTQESRWQVMWIESAALSKTGAVVRWGTHVAHAGCDAVVCLPFLSACSSQPGHS